jgi:hypothetical protein
LMRPAHPQFPVKRRRGACFLPVKRICVTVATGKSLESESLAAFTRCSSFALAGQSFDHAMWSPPVAVCAFLYAAFTFCPLTVYASVECPPLYHPHFCGFRHIELICPYLWHLKYCVIRHFESYLSASLRS